MAPIAPDSGNRSPYPLITARLTLRPLHPRDSEALAAMVADFEVSRYTGLIPHPYTVKDAEDFIAQAPRRFDPAGSLELAIERTEDGTLLGVIGVSRSISGGSAAEVGYWLGKEHWRRGYASEALACVITHAFDALKLERLTASVVPENQASFRVLEKLGFQVLGQGNVPAPARPGGMLFATFTVLTREIFRSRQAKPMVLVVAAALVDDQGRVLLQKRPEGKALAGLWEFPGGKVDPGETPERALVRELQEELGLSVWARNLEPLTFASHEYDTFHLLMPLYLCSCWQGTPSAREGQEIAWVSGDRIADYPMPPADIPLVPALLACLRLRTPPLAFTDEEGEAHRPPRGERHRP